jgi:hypothetical protein
MRAAVCVALLALLAMACSTSSTAGLDTGPDAAARDAGTDAFAAPDTRCDVSPVPASIPAFTADFQLDDPAGGTTPPTMTGGDPTGTWVFDHGTFWVDATANAMFNRWGSSVSGTAWIAITAGEFRLEYDLTTHLAGTIAGTIVQNTTTRAHARWRLDREQIEPTGLVCAESNQPSVGDPGRVTFTRSGDHLTLLTEVPQSTGLVIMQMEGTLAP